MSDPTRKDAGQGVNKLFILIELDLDTSLTTVETNIHDPAVMLRVNGQGMHIWADNKMKQQAAALAANGKRPLVMTPKH